MLVTRAIRAYFAYPNSPARTAAAQATTEITATLIEFYGEVTTSVTPIVLGTASGVTTYAYANAPTATTTIIEAGQGDFTLDAIANGLFQSFACSHVTGAASATCIVAYNNAGPTITGFTRTLGVQTVIVTGALIATPAPASSP